MMADDSRECLTLANGSKNDELGKERETERHLHPQHATAVPVLPSPLQTASGSENDHDDSDPDPNANQAKKPRLDGVLGSVQTNPSLDSELGAPESATEVHVLKAEMEEEKQQEEEVHDPQLAQLALDGTRRWARQGPR